MRCFARFFRLTGHNRFKYAGAVTTHQRQHLATRIEQFEVLADILGTSITLKYVSTDAFLHNEELTILSCCALM